MQTLKNRLCFVYQVLCAILLVAMVGINVTQVLCRYFISFSFIWAEDLSTYMLHWVVTFSIPMCWMLKNHMVMDVADSIFPKKVMRFFALLQEFVGLAFGIYMAHRGFFAAKVNKGYVLSILKYDEMWKYIPYGIMGILLFIAAAINLSEYYLQRKASGKGVVS